MRQALEMEFEALRKARRKILTTEECHAVIMSIKEALAQPEQKPVAWKLVPIEPTREMLEAMDECSIEGYDEHLYAGHAASVYMAAVDVAPTPPQPKKLDQDEVDIRSRLYQRIHELETQLAQPEQEPVATLDDLEQEIYENTRQFVSRDVMEWMLKRYYTTPPQRTWVGLTDEEVRDLWSWSATSEAEKTANTQQHAFARAIEVKLKEKNT